MLVTALGLLGVLAVLFVGGVVATRDTGLLVEAPPDRSPAAGPVTGAADLEAVRFSLVLRGYRMSEVDEVLDRAGAALASSEQALAEARAQLAATRAQLPADAPADGPGQGPPGWRGSGPPGTIGT